MRFDERIRGRNLVDARPAPSLSIISWNDASSERNTHVPQKKGERKVRARRRHAPILLASHDVLFFAIISVRRHTVEGMRLSFRSKGTPPPFTCPVMRRERTGKESKRCSPRCSHKQATTRFLVRSRLLRSDPDSRAFPSIPYP